jgi:hypothetical protein
MKWNSMQLCQFFLPERHYLFFRPMGYDFGSDSEDILVLVETSAGADFWPGCLLETDFKDLLRPGLHQSRDRWGALAAAAAAAATADPGMPPAQ